jgi:SAM-dependent methyltransferase
MPHWMIKAGLQRAVGALPKRRVCYELIQRFGSRALTLSSKEFEHKLQECRGHLANLRNHSRCDSFTMFELGTGWFPIVPIGMYLCGASQVTTCDIESLMRPHRVRRVLELFAEYAESHKLDALLPDWIPERSSAIQAALRLPGTAGCGELLDPMAIRLIVQNATQLPSPDASFDFIESTRVLEYIPAPVLESMFREFRRVLRPSGIMSHHIDLQDEYAYFDHSLSPFNFLRYSDAAWRRIRNPFTPLNRMRIGEYRRLIEEAGFRILSENNRQGSTGDLRKVPLASRFRDIDTEDLLVLRSWLVAGS